MKRCFRGIAENGTFGNQTLLTLMSVFQSQQSPGNATELTEIQVAAQFLAGGDAPEAVRRLQRLTQALPAYATAHVLLAKALEASDNWDAALEAWHQAHFLVPGSALVQRERSRLLDARANAIGFFPVEESISDAPDLAADSIQEDIQAEEPQPDTEHEVDAEAEEIAEIVASNLEAASNVQESAEVEVETMAEEVEAPVTQEPDLPPVEADSDVEEPIIAAPIDDAHDAPVAGSPEGEASWWKKPEEDEPKDESYVANVGWTVIDEAVEGVDRNQLVEPAVAPPEAYNPPPVSEEHDTDDVVEANVLSEDSSRQLSDELDSLINELEDAPRIRPDPKFSAPDEEDYSEELAEEMVSETLARIYAAQGEFEEAARVYERLATQHPEDADEMLAQAADMRAKGAEGTP